MRRYGSIFVKDVWSQDIKLASRYCISIFLICEVWWVSAESAQLLARLLPVSKLSLSANIGRSTSRSFKRHKQALSGFWCRIWNKRLWRLASWLVWHWQCICRFLNNACSMSTFHHIVPLLPSSTSRTPRMMLGLNLNPGLLHSSHWKTLGYISPTLKFHPKIIVLYSDGGT